MTPEEAAIILGVKSDEIRDYQKQGLMPNPIPDDYLDHFVQFRIDIAKAHLRKGLAKEARVDQHQ